MKKFAAVTLVVLGFIVAILSYFTITAGVLAVVVVFSALILMYVCRGNGLFKLWMTATILGVVGIALSALGVYGLMGQVHDHCSQLDPRSDEGITCFNEHYDSGWGLHHLLSLKN